MKRTSAVLSLVLLVAVGCQSEGESFEEAYNRAVRPLSEVSAGTGARHSDFLRLARRTERTRANLRRLDPPAEVRDELATLLRDLATATRDLGAVADAARRRDVPEQRAAARRLVRSSARVDRAERALKRALAE